MANESSKSPDALLPDVVAGLTPPLGSAGYKLQTQSERLLTYARDYRPWWIWLGAVVLFPIGLIGLFYKETATITVTLEDNAGQTRVRVNGTGEKGVHRAFEQMEL